MRHNHLMITTNQAKKTKYNLSLLLTKDEYQTLLCSLRTIETNDADKDYLINKLQKSLGEAKLKNDYGTKSVAKARRIQAQNMAGWACNPNSETYLCS